MSSFINHNETKNRGISIGLCVILLFTLIFSMYFIEAEAHHHCIGADCPVCATLDMCVTAVKQISTIFFAAAFLLLSVVCNTGKKVLHTIAYSYLTPVKEKVRMNN